MDKLNAKYMFAYIHKLKKYIFCCYSFNINLKQTCNNILKISLTEKIRLHK